MSTLKSIHSASYSASEHSASEHSASAPASETAPAIVAEPAGTSPGRRVGRAFALTLGVALCTTISAVIVGHTAQSLAGNRMAPWILGRSAGVTSYLLLVVLVLLGLVLSHPWRARWRRPSTAVRIRAHIALSVFTLAFTVLHVVVLATDRYAGVGWAGALLPMHADYRPLPTTLGVIGLWSGLLAGMTAAAAGRLPRRAWWPVHKVAAVSLVLVWAHGLLGGGDSSALRPMYLATGALVLAVAVSRYVCRTPSDHVEAVSR